MRLIDADALRGEFRAAVYPGGGAITMFDIIDIEAGIRAAPTVWREAEAEAAYGKGHYEDCLKANKDGVAEVARLTWMLDDAVEDKAGVLSDMSGLPMHECVKRQIADLAARWEAEHDD